jgi:hypothetical protein
MAADSSVTFRLPFFHRTKAEVVHGLVRADVADLARSTHSCAHPPFGHWHKQCGSCIACLERRLALVTAGIEESAGSYWNDLFSCSHRTMSQNVRRTINALFAFLYRLANLDAGGVFHPTDLNYLYDTEVIERGESPAALAHVFRRYRGEWLALLDAGQRHGWPWVEGFAPQKEAA